MAYAKPQQREKEESERPRGRRDQIKFINLRFKGWQVVRFRTAKCVGIRWLKNRNKKSFLRQH